ncbi:MAG: hypothetical protein WAQ28_04235 [Bacteroidia bacterium]|jgi:hypothetical protein
MKKYTLLIYLIAHIQMAFAQKDNTCISGVYLSYTDYINNNLTHSINTKIEGNSFGFIPFSKTIKVVTPDSTLKFNTGSIWGYKDCTGTYRYSPDVELLSPEDYYKIEENGGERELTIYSSVFDGGAEYFFSTGLNLPIHRLNMKHLEYDFGGLFPKFIKEAKKLNKKKDGLSTRDKNGHFTINTIYKETILR